MTDGQPQGEPRGGDPTTAEVLAALGHVPTPKVAGAWTVDAAAAALGVAAPAAGSAGSASPLPYFHLLELLKTTKREGWRRFGISGGESVADHMYRMALISMLAPPALAARLDMGRCLKMCLVHDMAEALVGDITPVDGVPKPEKSRREATTMDYVAGRLAGAAAPAVGADLRAVWQEYEDAQTPESHFVHDVDKMELLLQMAEYEQRAQGRVDLSEFAYVATKMTLPETRAWAAELLQERDAFWARLGRTPASGGGSGKSEKEGEGEKEGVKEGQKEGQAGDSQHKRLQDEYYRRGPSEA